ncbi:MAG: hypothetical protein H0V81_03690 [Solirubrobacterales bacterium]|nr:hypothetical protein [Solirubrobacterales bacterium]
MDSDVLRRLPVALGALGLLLVLAVLILPSSGSRTDEPRAAAASPAGIVTLPDAAADPPLAVRAPRSDAWRKSELRRIKGSRTVAAALRRAWLARRIDAATYAGYRGTWARTRAAATRLRGTSAREQQSVLALARGLAADRRLDSSRLGPVFLTLRRNTNFWSSRQPPRAKQRFVFGRDPVVFRYEPGQGLQIHWLGTWGKANGRARFCLEKPKRCPKKALRRELDRLVRLASRRSGYDAYESLYRFGGGGPGWVSGMTQGTAVQAMARARRAIEAPRFGSSARRALGAFEQPPPAGIRVPDGAGSHYLMYSFAPGLRILNGNLQAIAGLYDAAQLTGSRRARRLFRRGDRAARPAIGRYDTGAWSLYAAQGREATLSYHRLVDGFLENLCARTRRDAYCAPAKRFGRYLREPTRVQVDVPSRPRARRAASIAVWVSKRSKVVVSVARPGRASFERVLDVGRGQYAVGWVPPLTGTYRVRVLAQGPSGPRGEARQSVRVRAPARARPVREKERGKKTA